MNKKKIVRIIIITLLLITLLLINNSKERKHPEMILIGLETELITLDDKKVIEDSHSFPGKNFGNYENVKVLRQGKKNTWMIMSSPLRNEKLMISRLRLNNDRSVKFDLLYNGQNRRDLIEPSVDYFLNCDSEGFIDGFGNKCQIVNKDSGKPYVLDDSFSEKLSNKGNINIFMKNWENKYFGDSPVGGLNISDRYAVYQVTRDSRSYSDFYPSGLSDNYIYLVKKEQLIAKGLIYRKGGVRKIKTGYIPRYQGCRVEEFYTPLPICLSPDKRKAALLIRYETPDYEWYNVDPAPVWLCIIDLKSFKVDKITTLNTNLRSGFSSYLPLSWHTYKGKDYVSLSICAISYSETGPPKNVSMLIDIKNKKIIKKWPWFSKSMRWSPDGRYLGMLRNGYKNDWNSQTFYIYDFENNRMLKSAQYFGLWDFFWIY